MTVKPERYSLELHGSIYDEVLFRIEADQFDEEDEISAPEGAFDELKDVTEEAQAITDKHRVEVSVEVYGRWGHYGRDTIEFLTFKPKPLAPLFQGIRDDLAELRL